MRTHSLIKCVIKMILEDATKEAFGYYSRELASKSHKSILAACEFCGEIRIISKSQDRYFCNSCSLILGGKRKGKNNPMFGKHSWNFGKDTLKETKAKQSVAMKGRYLGENNPMFGLTGEDSPNFGRHFSEVHKAKLRAAHKGEKNYNYKGGKKAAKARSSAKRDRELGFNILIDLREGDLFHHVTNEYVIGIPANVHQKLSGGNSRKKHRTRVLQWLKTHDKKKYKLVLCVLAKQPLKENK